MSEDVFDKLDALIKKHAANEPEIPVLTDLVEPPRIDLNAIPVLTEEIIATPAPLEYAPSFEAAHIDFAPAPIDAETSLTQHEDITLDVPVETEAYLDETSAPPPLESPPTLSMEMHQEDMTLDVPVEAYLDETPAPTPLEPPPTFSMEVPQNAEYVLLQTPPIETPTPVIAPPVAPAPAQTLTLPDDTLHNIAKLIETDVARVLKDSLHQTLSAELSGMLNLTLDKALSSMLDQHMMMIEETVRSTIADELKKQLAPFKRPPKA